MGCGGSKDDLNFVDEVGPDGPLAAAPATLLVTGHADNAYNGVYQRGAQPWNGKAMYCNGQRYLYYYNCNEGGAPGWSLDHRDQPHDAGGKDWCVGGYLGMHGGPAYPPLCGGIELGDVDGHAEDVSITITEPEPAVPPAALSISGHPDGGADGLYSLAGDLWNGRPHYHSSSGWCFYYYARNEGGSCGWSLHPELVPQGAKDDCDGGWVGQYTWSHPPVGEELGFNDAGRVSVRAALGDTAMASQVHALLVQSRQELWAAHGVALQPAVMDSASVAAQPMVYAQVVPMAMAQPVQVPMAQPVMAKPVA